MGWGEEGGMNAPAGAHKFCAFFFCDAYLARHIFNFESSGSCKHEFPITGLRILLMTSLAQL